MEYKKYKLLIVGAGKVGTAVGNLLYGRGHQLVAAVAMSGASLEKAAPFLPGAILINAGKDSSAAVATAEAARQSDVILITTKDEQIKDACEMLAAGGALTSSHTVMHMSGASSLDVLASARAAGSKVASIHPIQSFASIELAVQKLPGSYFGVTATGPARDVALEIARDLGGEPIDIADEDKALYHAAACITSNYLVSLLYLAEKVYNAAGLSEAVAIKAMMPLIKGTVSNIESVGTVAALTGPIARGDVAVIEKHLKSLEALDTDIAGLYKSLGLQTIEVARKKGALSEEAAAKLTALLSKNDEC